MLGTSAPDASQAFVELEDSSTLVPACRQGRPCPAGPPSILCRHSLDDLVDAEQCLLKNAINELLPERLHPLIDDKR